MAQLNIKIDDLEERRIQENKNNSNVHKVLQHECQQYETEVSSLKILLDDIKLQLADKNAEIKKLKEKPTQPDNSSYSEILRKQKEQDDQQK